MHENLVPLNLPEPSLKLAKKDGVLVVWDDIRKKYLKLTPEEWVRQHLVHFLRQNGFPASSIALEGGFHLNQKLQRTDILVYKNARPTLLIECKAPQVKVDQKVFDQAARYNLHYNTSLLVLSNGLVHFAARVDHHLKKYHFLDKIPSYDEL